MTLASDLRNIASEARKVIARGLEDAEILKGLSKVCRDKGIDWGQLKALVKAQEQDALDGGHRVEKIVEKADFASAYAELLSSNMNNKSESCSSSPAPVQETPAPEPAPVTEPEPEPEQERPRGERLAPASQYIMPSDGSIPAFLRREQVAS